MTQTVKCDICHATDLFRPIPYLQRFALPEGWLYDFDTTFCSGCVGVLKNKAQTISLRAEQDSKHLNESINADYRALIDNMKKDHGNINIVDIKGLH